MVKVRKELAHWLESVRIGRWKKMGEDDLHVSNGKRYNLFLKYIESHRAHGSATTIIRVEDLITRQDTEYLEDPGRECTQDPVSTRARNSECPRFDILKLYE